LASLPPALTSHTHPEPNRATPAALNASLNFSKSPNDALIASASLPVGPPPPFGPIVGQNCEWFQWPPPLLRTAVRTASGTLFRLRSRSSSDLSASSGAFSSAALRLVT